MNNKQRFKDIVKKTEDKKVSETPRAKREWKTVKTSETKTAEDKNENTEAKK